MPSSRRASWDNILLPAAYQQQTVMVRYEIYSHEKIALLRITARQKPVERS